MQSIPALLLQTRTFHIAVGHYFDCPSGNKSAFLSSISLSLFQNYIRVIPRAVFIFDYQSLILAALVE